MNLIYLVGTQLIPVLVPIIVSGLKSKALPALPKWSLPILAGALGPAIDFLLAALAAKSADPVKGAIYALAGVGVREVYDQGKKALADL